MAPKEAPYGLWESPITTDFLSSGVTTLDGVAVDPSTQKIYLLEGRSTGRNEVVEISDGKTRDIIPEPKSVGTAVYGYGGPALAVTGDSKLIFTNKPDGATFALDLNSGNLDEVLNKENYTYCDYDPCKANPRWMLALQQYIDPATKSETHSVHSVCVVDLKEKKVNTLAEGADFYWGAQFSPKGDQICWLEWNHPNMPWQGSTLHVADFADGAIKNQKPVAGSPEGRAVLEPRWGPDGSLYFTDDITGYSQPQVLRPGAEAPISLNLPGLDGVEFIGTTLMRMGSSTYQLLSEDLGVFSYIHKAECTMIAVNLKTSEVTDLGLSFANITYSSMKRLGPKEFVFTAATKTEPFSLYKATIQGNTAKLEILRRSTNEVIPKEYISVPKAFTCPRTRGPNFEDLPHLDVTHFFYMPPTNKDYKAPAGTLPPLILYGHGGPTGIVTPALWYDFQYWTSRGYAALLLNYTGSIGFGRDYRTGLDGKWGVIDSADAASAVEYLADQGLVDRSRLGIYGLSAGGFLVLKTLCDFPDVWAGGVSLFGVTDTKLLEETTHKFESKYLDRLLFPSGADASQKERDVIHYERSPINLAESIKCPVLQLQGTADIVVPPKQAEDMDEKLRKNGKEVKTVWFEGEGHAIWKGESFKKSMTEQEAWFRKTLVRPSS